jgi:hypothetical protein
LLKIDLTSKFYIYNQYFDAKLIIQRNFLLKFTALTNYFDLFPKLTTSPQISPGHFYIKFVVVSPLQMIFIRDRLKFEALGHPFSLTRSPTTESNKWRV